MGSPVVLLGLIVISKRMMEASFLPTGKNCDDDDYDYDTDVASTNDDEDLQ